MPCDAGPTYRGTSHEFQHTSDPRADAWPPEYAPRKEDIVILKNKPSAFFETPLESFLRYDHIDTLVVVGVSTSGCERAAATDAFSHNFRVIVIEGACGDRSVAAHCANLFDLDRKFADVEKWTTPLPSSSGVTAPQPGHGVPQGARDGVAGRRHRVRACIVCRRQMCMCRTGADALLILVNNRR